MDDSNNGLTYYSMVSRDGLWAGLLMLVFFVCAVYVGRFPLLSALSFAVLLVTPWFVWRMVRRLWIRRVLPPTFSGVWFYGIMTYLLGAIVVALGVYLLLGVVEPGWIEEQTMRGAERLAQEGKIGKAEEVAKIVQEGRLPSAIQVSFGLLWLIGFTGSLWGMLYATILTRSKYFRDLRNANVKE